jgi:hypothetical protein
MGVKDKIGAWHAKLNGKIKIRLMNYLGVNAFAAFILTEIGKANARITDLDGIKITDLSEEINHERDLRLQQCNRLEIRVNKRIKQLQEEMMDRFGYVASRYDEILQMIGVLQKKGATSKDLAKKIDFLNNVHETAKLHYENYLIELKREISEFAKSDNAVVRLSSLESRITLMEIRHRESSDNGSRQELSG